MSPTKRLALCAAMLALSTIMCIFPNLDTESFTKAKPQSSDLVGKYVPTVVTLQFIRDEGHYKVVDSSMVISPDGTFEMSSMPDWWHTEWGDPKGGFDSGRGKWSIVKDQGSWQIILDFSSRKDFSSDRASTGLTTNVFLVREKPPYQIWFYVGDMDAGHVMIFEQVQSK